MTALRSNTRRRSAGTRFLLPVLMIVVLLVLGCSGDDDDDSAATTTATDPRAGSQTETKEEQADAAADKRIAEEAVFVLEDFPTGWQQVDDEDDAQEEAPCSGIRDARDAVSARASSPEFREGESAQAQSIAYLYPDEATATQAFGSLTSDESRACLGEAFGEALGERLGEQAGPAGGGAEVGEPETSRVSIEPLGDEREAVRITVSVSAEGIEVDLVIDTVFVRVGRGIALPLFVDTFSAFDEDLKADLTSTVVRRLSAGLD
jgi:hypothetical protein